MIVWWLGGKLNRTAVSASMRAFADTFTETFSSAHLCCAACAYDHFLFVSQANSGREQKSSWLSHRCLERQVAVET